MRRRILIEIDQLHDQIDTLGRTVGRLLRQDILLTQDRRFA